MPEGGAMEGMNQPSTPTGLQNTTHQRLRANSLCRAPRRKRSIITDDTPSSPSATRLQSSWCPSAGYTEPCVTPPRPWTSTGAARRNLHDAYPRETGSDDNSSSSAAASDTEPNPESRDVSPVQQHEWQLSTSPSSDGGDYDLERGRQDDLEAALVETVRRKRLRTTVPHDAGLPAPTRSLLTTLACTSVASSSSPSDDPPDCWDVECTPSTAAVMNF